MPCFSSFFPLYNERGIALWLIWSQCLFYEVVERYAVLIYTQIVDTDDAYVADKHVVAGKQPHPFVDVDNKVIRTRNRRGIINRNWNKRDMLDRLIDCGEVYNIPYRVLYLSSDLEHVLHNKPNIYDRKEKERLSNDFALRYEGNLAGFIDFISKSSFSVKKGYRESWDYLRDERFDSRSLERHTNLGVLFREASAKN